jgi:hypothetical protein
LGFVIGSVAFAIASSSTRLLVFVSTLVEQTEIERWPAVTDSYARSEQWCVRYVPPPEEGDERFEGAADAGRDQVGSRLRKGSPIVGGTEYGNER